MTEEEFIEAETARGELAFAPDELLCYRCNGMKKVVRLGKVVEMRRDPTQTYELECTHLAI